MSGRGAEIDLQRWLYPFEASMNIGPEIERELTPQKGC
jgi:hypothetical protein